MWSLRLSVLASALFVSHTLCSFYDNPELELPPAGGTPLDELKEKWDFDVSFLTHCPFCSIHLAWTERFSLFLDIGR